MSDNRIHAFTDDALGEHDAVGLVEALHAGEVSIPEVVEAAIARAERVQPELNGIAYEAFDRARAEALRSAAGLLRRRTDLAQGQRRDRRDADHAGHRRLDAGAGEAGR